jgi:transcriptional regulator with XRE-family HTH domain
MGTNNTHIWILAQYPHMDSHMSENPPMTQADTIAKNLSAWMESNPSLDTLKKVATRSGVGFGTVQRIKNGEGNPTRKSLEGVAKAFGRTAEDLLRQNVVAGVNSVDASGAVGLVTAKVDPVLIDLEALEPEDADVWRAQIRAAATKIRRQRSAETSGFAPKPPQVVSATNIMDRINSAAAESAEVLKPRGQGNVGKAATAPASISKRVRHAKA